MQCKIKIYGWYSQNTGANMWQNDVVRLNVYV